MEMKISGKIEMSMKRYQSKMKMLTLYSYKYLGVYIDEQLNFNENAQYIFKKSYFLRL